MERAKKEQGGVLDRGLEMTNRTAGFPTPGDREDADGEDTGPVLGSC